MPAVRFGAPLTEGGHDGRRMDAGGCRRAAVVRDVWALAAVDNPGVLLSSPAVIVQGVWMEDKLVAGDYQTKGLGMAKTVNLLLGDVKVGKRHRKLMRRIPELAESIESVGLLHPVVVTPDYRLIAGRRRLLAYKHLKREKIEARIIDLEAVVYGEQAENFEREDFTPSERVSIEDAILPLERDKAKKRQREHRGTAPGKRKDTSGKFPEVKADGEARTRAAKAAGWDRRTSDRAHEIVKAADEEPEKFAELKEEMDDTGRVAGVYKKLTVARQAGEIAKEPPPLPKGPFRVIVADPPWTYSGRATDASHRAANPYASMTIEDIKAYLPAKLPHEDCVLWLWTTNAHMREAFEVLDAWGFEHKTILTWVKHKMGTGDWLRGKTEHCLLAVRGKPTITLTNQTTALEAEAGKHSAKPEAFYVMVRKLCPGARVELFQREPHEGFVGAGLESE